jgi:hypothetical protein
LPHISHGTILMSPRFLAAVLAYLATDLSQAVRRFALLFLLTFKYCV